MNFLRSGYVASGDVGLNSYQAFTIYQKGDRAVNTGLIYKMIAKVYDLLDVVYFRDFEHSPRKVVLDRIAGEDRILDLCTGTATNAINIASKNPGAKVVGVDLSKQMLNVGKSKAKAKGLRNIRLYEMDATKLTVTDFNRNNTYIQSEGINQDFGIYDNPDKLLAEHGQEIGPVKKLAFRYYGRHRMNRNVKKIRG